MVPGLVRRAYRNKGDDEGGLISFALQEAIRLAQAAAEEGAEQKRLDAEERRRDAIQRRKV